MTPDELDAAYGLAPGTVRGWVRLGVVPPDPDEYAVVVAYLERPAFAAGDHQRSVADWAARVREALSRREAGCQTTADPSAASAG